ncbi:MAG: type II secretion system protein [archaeon]
MRSKLGQVWIETVLYTIVGLAIIGIVLGFAMPKINQSKDNIVIQQSINSMKEIDSQIREVARSSGSLRIPEFTIRRGFLDIDGVNNKIFLKIDDLSNLYSENNVSFNDGNVNIVSLKGDKKNSVIISLNYANFNITYEGSHQNKVLAPAASAYKISIYNNGTNMDFKIS